MRTLIADWESSSSQKCETPKIGCFVKAGSRRKPITLVKELSPLIYLAYSGPEPFLIACYNVVNAKNESKALIGNCDDIPRRGDVMQLYCFTIYGEWIRIETDEIKSVISLNDNLYKVDIVDGKRYYVVINY